MPQPFNISLYTEPRNVFGEATRILHRAERRSEVNRLHALPVANRENLWNVFDAAPPKEMPKRSTGPSAKEIVQPQFRTTRLRMMFAHSSRARNIFVPHSIEFRNRVNCKPKSLRCPNYMVAAMVSIVLTAFGLIGYFSQKQDEDKWHTSMQNQLQAGQYNAVIEEANRALIYYPNSARLHVCKAHALVQLDKRAEALADLATALACEPDDSEIYNFRGRIYVRMGKFKEALADFDRISSDQNISTRNYYFSNRAVAELGLGQFKEALGDINAAIKLDPGNGQFYYTRALTRTGLFDWKGAIQDWNKVIAYDPKDTRALAARAQCFLKLRDYERTLHDYKQIGKLNQKENYPNFLVAQAKVEINLAKYSEAISDLSKAIAFNVNKLPGRMIRRDLILARKSRAACYEAMGQFAKATLDYDVLLRRNHHEVSEAPRLYMKRGILFTKCSNYQLAEADFSKAIALKPSLAGAYFYRGTVRAKERLYPQALTDLRMAVKLAPHSRGAKLRLAQIAQSKERSDMALLNDNGIREVSSRNGYRKELNNDPQIAIEHFDHVVRAAPNDAHARRCLAYSLSQAGRHKEAVVQFFALRHLVPRLTADDESRLDRALLASGWSSAAAGALRQSLESDPNSGQFRQLVELYTAEFNDEAARRRRRASQQVLLPPRVNIGG
jgi:tetratricopeptide (TPR) repeat protein